MNKKILVLLLLSIVSNFGYTQSDKIKIKSEHLTEANYLKMDDFYLTHYLYIDLFLRENLFPEASPKEVSSILKALKKYVSVENKLDIEIEKPGKRNYLIRFVILKKDDGTELLIAFTNWTVQKKAFEKDIKMENDSYTRWYFLNNSKMTYRKDMSDQNDYSEMNDIDLANAYLFDELTDNDGEIRNTISKVLLQSSLNVPDRIMANLILLKHHLFLKESDEVNEQVVHLEELFQEHKNETDLGRLKMIFEATKFQISLMRQKD